MENKARGNLVGLYGWRKLAKTKVSRIDDAKTGFRR